MKPSEKKNSALAAARRGERGGDPVEPTERGLDARLCLSYRSDAPSPG